MDYTMLGSIVVGLGTLGAMILTAQRIWKNAKEARKEEFDAAILANKDHFDNELSSVRKDMENMEESFEKDLEHLKETYNNELKTLSGKIEDLREELRTSHTQVVTLLTKMVNGD